MKKYSLSLFLFDNQKVTDYLKLEIKYCEKYTKIGNNNCEKEEK